MTLSQLRNQLLLSHSFPDIQAYWKSDGGFTASCTLDDHENAFPVTLGWLERSITSLEQERAVVENRLEILISKAQQRWLEMAEHVTQFFNEVKRSGGEYRHAKMLEAVEGNLELIHHFRPSV